MMFMLTRDIANSISGIHVPSEQLQIPFTLEGVIAGFDTRPPTQDELDDNALHIELTSDVEWIPYTFTDSLAEEEDPIIDNFNEEKIINLRARRLKVLDSKAAQLKINSCMQTLSSTQFPFDVQLANEVSALSLEDPILRRIAALTTIKANSEVTIVAAIRNGDVTSEVTPGNVAKRWMVGLETAKNSLKVTTQRGIRSIPNPAIHRFKAQMAHLHYPRLRGMCCADIMEPKIKSIGSHQYAHVIGNGRGYTKAYPMERKNESIYALDDFIKKVGIPEVLLCDNDATMEEKDSQVLHRAKVHGTLLTIPKQSQFGYTRDETNDL
jgi:hypothetical protein